MVPATFLYAGLIACAHPISEDFRAHIDPNLQFQQIFKKTNDYLGKSVMFGGIIVNTRNFDNRAEIEVIQKDLDSFGYPSRANKTGGRFIFVKEGFFEPEIWSKGRYVTGAGVIKGQSKGKIDNKDYRYPLIEVSELKLWQKRFNDSNYYGPYYRPYFLYGYQFGRFRNFGLRYYPF